MSFADHPGSYLVTSHGELAQNSRIGAVGKDWIQKGTRNTDILRTAPMTMTLLHL